MLQTVPVPRDPEGQARLVCLPIRNISTLYLFLRPATTLLEYGFQSADAARSGSAVANAASMSILPESEDSVPS